MRIAIVDADLIGRKKHRFPNLVCMKLSAYYKEHGDNVSLLTEYTSDLEQFDKIFLSKVFTDTEVPNWVLNLNNIEYGGTGFYYDKAPALQYEVEHHKPDYDLYSQWVQQKINEGCNKLDFKYYTDYSIGFVTRGCFRQCSFCVNKNYKKVNVHSPLDEFLDPQRPKICLLDDNFFGCSEWKRILIELKNTGKPFQFKQGLDERLLIDEKCEMLFNSKYDGDYIFAFDNIADAEIIEEKLKMIRKYSNSNIKFYVFCGFDRDDKWDENFWKQDLVDTFERIKILARYKAIPYIMRYKDYKLSPYRGIYVNLSRWCNQPNFFKNEL